MPSASRNLVRSTSYSSSNSEKCGGALHAEKIDNIAIYAVLSVELLADIRPLQPRCRCFAASCGDFLVVEYCRHLKFGCS